MQGKRLPDTILGELPEEITEEGWFKDQPGSYWKVLSRKKKGEPLRPNDMYPDSDFSGNLTNEVWGIVTPNGLYGLLTLHTVREEPDGTISVRPGDGSSNSILVQGVGPDGESVSYHGYIEHGVWTEC